MGVSASAVEPEEDWTPSATFRSVGRLTSWLMLLGTLAGLGAGIGVGVVAYESVNTKAAGIALGLVAGILAGLVAMTPYFVVVALLDLLNGISERLSWVADFLYERSSSPDE